MGRSAQIITHYAGASLPFQFSIAIDDPGFDMASAAARVEIYDRATGDVFYTIPGTLALAGGVWTAYFKIAKDATADMTAGLYGYALCVETGTDRRVAADDFFLVKPHRHGGASQPGEPALPPVTGGAAIILQGAIATGSAALAVQAQGNIPLADATIEAVATLQAPLLAAGAKFAFVSDSIGQYALHGGAGEGQAGTGGMSLNADTPPTISVAGAGYSVGDVLSLSGGTTVYQVGQIKVLTVGGAGEVTSIEINGWPNDPKPGSYEISPASPNLVTGGTGTGCQIAFPAAPRSIYHRANGEVQTAKIHNNRIKHVSYIDHAATIAASVPAYGGAMGLNAMFRGHDLGMAGDYASAAGVRIDQAMAMADVIGIGLGTNTGPGDDAVTTLAALQAQVAQVRANSSKRCVIRTPLPRSVIGSPVGGNTAISEALRDRLVAIRAGILANWQAWGAHALWDPWEAMRDQAFAPGHQYYGTPVAGATRDGTHITPLGAYLSAVSRANGAIPLRDAIAEVVAPGLWFDPDLAAGNLLANPNFSGNVAAPSGFTGVAPTGWNAIIAGANISCACSLESNAATGGQNWIFTVTSNGGGAANALQTITINPSLDTSSGFLATDWLQLFHNFDIDASPIFSSYQNYLGNGNTITTRGNGISASTYASISSLANCGVTDGWVETLPMLAAWRTSTRSRFVVHVRADVVGTAQFKLRGGKLMKVEDPAVTAPFIP